jgi:ABC-type Zn uptake system ZnuABC Zn-binding protein ZnuA
VTTTQLADVTRNIAGDRIRVVGLLEPNRDAHAYDPSPDDVNQVAAAALVVANGVGLDDWIDVVVKRSGASPPLVVASKGLRLRPGDDRSRAGDPHVWFDPQNVRQMATTIRDALIEADPAGAAGYRLRAAAYDAELVSLDAEIAAIMDGVPKPKRTLVTNHDAFGYFADHYGIRVVGAAINSLSAAAEPNARDIARLADTMRTERVSVVFAEEAVDAKLERALAESAGIAVGPALFGDSLGKADGPGGTYIAMMRTNAERLAAGFLAR